MRTLLASVLTIALLCVGATGVLAEEAEGTTPRTVPTVFLAGSGSFEVAALEFPDPVMNPETGILEMRDGWIEFMIDSEDPRIDGPYRAEPLNMDIDPNTGIARMWGTGHIVQEGGTFEGPVRGFSRPLGEDVDAYTVSGWLTGTGDFKGLAYHYRATFDGEEAFSEAIIYEGEVPPVE